jgi:uncharacterized damage-inducible protein DinB
MSNTAQEYADAFIRHRQPILDLLAQIPAEHSTFAIRAGAMNFVQMVDHLSMTDDYLQTALLGEKFVPAAPSPDLAAALEKLKNNTPKVVAFLEGISDEQLNADINAFRQTWKVYRLIEFGREHEAHHKGQLWLMARAIGIEPPMFYRF